MSITEITKVSKGERTRARILQQAQILFARNGYKATGVDEIVGSIGLTSGVFYSNFKSKQDLLNEVINQQIAVAKLEFFTTTPGDSSTLWLQRFLASYLSPAHRDQLGVVCPLTVMSQEIIKLNLHRNIGLADYAAEFEETIAMHLARIKPGKERLATTIVSLCVGTLLMTRLDPDKQNSTQVLANTRGSLSALIMSVENR